MNAISSTLVVDQPCGRHYLTTHVSTLRAVNSSLRYGVTDSPVFALFISSLLRLSGLARLYEWRTQEDLSVSFNLFRILYLAFTHTLSLIQSLLLHPFFEIRRSVYGPQIFWEYASVTFSLCTAWATANSLLPTRILLERVMAVEQWVLLMLFVGLIQFLVIPLGSPRARAVACVLALTLWLPLVLIFIHRAGIRGPVPGFIVFAFGNYLHVFSLLRYDPPDNPNCPKEPPQLWNQPAGPTST
jgi:hypothetical protein